MSTTRAQIVKDWLSHPGARIVKQQFRRAAVKALREYDKAKTKEELIFIQVKRQILLETIPAMLDQLTFEPEKPRFNWRRLLGIKK